MTNPTKLATVLALALGGTALQAQSFTYIDLQDGLNFPGAATAVDATTDSDATWGLGDDGAAYGWRYRTTGPGVPAYNGTAYTGRYPNQGAGAPDPGLYMPLSGLLPNTEYFVRVYAIYAQNSTNAVVSSRQKAGAEFSVDGGTTWSIVDNLGGATLNWVDNSTALGAPRDGTAGDTRAWALLPFMLETDALGNGRLDVRLPQFLTGGLGQDRFSFDGIAIAVPEPTSFALIGLGAAAMLISRRRH
ncbi:MAG TPA: PEP-CTERM sorting domain-containing protein [Verrucomicrobiae bacterium]|nr:PEP-CTERM sorting domain-containing protein [Verrucomicrobiae bacterium]